MHEFLAGDAPVTGYLALPPSGTGPGVLVLHAWWGLVPTFTEVCDRLAAEGFVALAPDLYAGRTATTIADAEALQQVMETSDHGARMSAVAGDALAHLRDDSHVTGAVVGIVAFSLGVWYALGLSGDAHEAITAVVAFYGTGEAEQPAAQTAYQGHFAEHDPYVSPDEMQSMETALRAAGCETEFHVYPGTRHWFFEADRVDAYDASAAQLAWSAPSPCCGASSSSAHRTSQTRRASTRQVGWVSLTIGEVVSRAATALARHMASGVAASLTKRTP